MDKLTPEQQAAITKMSSYRLMQKLVNCGVSEQELEKMEREGMKNLWAKFVKEGKDIPKDIPKTEAPGATAVSTYDADLEKKKFEFEKLRWETEVKERQRDRELDLINRETEAKEKQRDRELELKREERELRREEREIKMLELEQLRLKEEKEARIEAEIKRSREREEDEQRRRDREDAERDRLDSPIYKAKLFSEGMKGLLYPQPSDISALVCYFENVERLFKEFRVDENLQVHLLKPHLSEKARSLISRMNPDKSLVY